MLQEISDYYVRVYGVYQEEVDRIQEKKDRLSDLINAHQSRIHKLNVKQDKLNKTAPFWKDYLIKPIAEAMLPLLPGRHFELLGPFGIGARVSIHFYRDGVTDEDKWRDENCLSITFEPGDLQKGELQVVDHLTNTGTFNHGTIGEINGFNHPCVDIPEDADSQWFVDWMMKQNPNK